MKQKTLLFSAFVGILYLALSSNKNGPAAQNSLNATGGPGSTQTCSSVSCHAGPSGSTTGTIELRKKSDGSSSTPITTYQNDTTYIVTVTCTNSVSVMSKFGLQLEAVDSATSASAGTFSNLGAVLHNSVIGGKTLIEHSAPITKSSATGTISFDWKAPTSGIATIKFYSIVNSSNNDNSPFGDVPSSPLVASYKNAAASVGTLDNSISLSVFPNPCINILTLRMEHAASGTYSINAFDLRGKKVTDQQIEVSSASTDFTMHTDKWAAGYYMVQIVKDGNTKVIPVVKR